MPRDDRHQLNVYLSGAAFEAWRGFAETHGVSITALLEALGSELNDWSRSQSPLIFRRAARRAVAIDIERRSRRTR